MMNGVLIPDVSTRPALAEVTSWPTDGWSRRLALLEQIIGGLRAEVAEQDQLFGRKSERDSRRDRSNQLQDPQEPAAGTSPRRRGQQPGRRDPGRRDYSHLAAVEEFVELSEDQQCCPTCGRPRQPRADTEDSDQIEIEVQAHRRVIRRRRNEATCDCPAQPHTLTALTFRLPIASRKVTFRLAKRAGHSSNKIN
jgi:hypothetical protein